MTFNHGVEGSSPSALTIELIVPSENNAASTTLKCRRVTAATFFSFPSLGVSANVIRCLFKPLNRIVVLLPIADREESLDFRCGQVRV